MKYTVTTCDFCGKTYADNQMTNFMYPRLTKTVARGGVGNIILAKIPTGVSLRSTDCCEECLVRLSLFAKEIEE